MTTQQSPGPRDGRAIAVYTGARLGLFVLCLVLAWVVGLNGGMLLIVALVASGVLSWFVLRRPRVAMSTAVERRVARVQHRIDARSAAEDAYVDSLQGTHPPDRSA